MTLLPPNQKRRDLLVSVIVPAYNASDTLGEALESLRNQTCGDWEAIVIDDGSADDTERVAHFFSKRDKRFRIVCQENKGVSVARNVGMSLAQGEWLAFLDADDTLSPGYLEGMLKGAEDGVCLIIGGAEEARGNMSTSKVVGHEKHLLLKGEEINHVAESVLDNEGHGIDGYCPKGAGYICSKLYRRSVLGGLRFDSRIGMREDALFNVEALGRSDLISVVCENGYTYRLRDGSSSARFRRNYYSEIEIFLASCRDAWLRWNLDARSFDKGVLIAYMSWLKLAVLHEDVPFTKAEQNRLIAASFDDILWQRSFERLSPEELSLPYRLLKRAFLAESVRSVRMLKWLNDVKHRCFDEGR